MVLAAYESAPPPLDEEIDEELAEVCRRALQRDPDERFEDAQQMRRALAEVRRHQGSLALSRTADELLAELEALLVAEVSDRDFADVLRVVTECRFGYRAARDGWADNPRVAPGLSRCLELAVRAEIERRDPEAARAFLRELSSPPEELGSAIEALEGELTEERAERARLEQLAHDTNTQQNATGRAVAGLVGAGMLAVLTVFGIRENMGDGLVMTDLLWLAGITTVGFAVLFPVFGTRLLTNEFNRRLATWLLVQVVVIDAHRVFAWLRGVTTETAEVFVVDLLLLSAGFASGAVFMWRWMWWLAGSLALAAVLAAIFPRYSGPIFGVCSVLVMLDVAYFSFRKAR